MRRSWVDTNLIMNIMLRLVLLFLVLILDMKDYEVVNQ